MGEGGSIYTHGGYVESGYMVTEKLQMVGRTSSVWNTEGPAQGSAWEAGGGFNYFFNKHNLKFSMDVNWVDISEDMIPMTEKLAGLDDASPPTAGTAGFQFDSYSSSSANLSEFKGVLLRTQMQIYF